MRRLFGDRGLRLLAAAAIVGACSAATVKGPRDTITFSHHVHAEQGLACADCHAAVKRDAEDPEAKARMKMSACGDCHDVQDAAKCGTCHTNAAAPETYEALPETHVLFSHERHAPRTEDCAACHAKAADAPSFTDKDRLLPAHPECDACHQKDMDAGRCQLCHDRLDLNPRTPKTVYSHAPGFFERHGRKAAAGEQDQCAVCHDQSFCADCHARTMTVTPALRFPERVDRSTVHGGDYISKHVLEARTGDTGCLKCHGTSFCEACHEREGVGGAIGQRNPHPPGWMTPGSAENHGREARRHIEECAACHDQGPASNCVQCHKSGGVNPHPPGGQSPVPRSERAHHKMCKICHTD